MALLGGPFALAPHSAASLVLMNRNNAHAVGFILGQLAVINILVVVVLTLLAIRGW